MNDNELDNTPTAIRIAERIKENRDEIFSKFGVVEANIVQSLDKAAADCPIGHYNLFNAYLNEENGVDYDLDKAEYHLKQAMRHYKETFLIARTKSDMVYLRAHQGDVKAMVDALRKYINYCGQHVHVLSWDWELFRIIHDCYDELEEDLMMLDL